MFTELIKNQGKTSDGWEVGVFGRGRRPGSPQPGHLTREDEVNAVQEPNSADRSQEKDLHNPDLLLSLCPVEPGDDGRGSTIVTSNRAIEEWIPLFDDPILAQSALDRLAHNAYQIVMEGDSYRSRQRPGITPPPPLRKRRN